MTTENKKCRTLIKAVPELVQNRFTGDEVLYRGYLRRKSLDCVFHSLSLFRGYLGPELQQDCYLSESRLEGFEGGNVTNVVNGHDEFWERTKGWPVVIPTSHSVDHMQPRRLYLSWYDFIAVEPRITPYHIIITYAKIINTNHSSLLDHI